MSARWMDEKSPRVRGGHGTTTLDRERRALVVTESVTLVGFVLGTLAPFAVGLWMYTGR